MDKVKNADEHIWYAEQVAKNGWSRNVLVHQIESGLYQRQGRWGGQCSTYRLKAAFTNAAFSLYTSYNIVTVEGAAASRVFFHLKAEAVRMGE